jgi:hypothetical protein
MTSPTTQKDLFHMISDVFMVVKMMIIFWILIPCGLVSRYQQFYSMLQPRRPWSPAFALNYNKVQNIQICYVRVNMEEGVLWDQDKFSRHQPSTNSMERAARPEQSAMVTHKTANAPSYAITVTNSRRTVKISVCLQNRYKQIFMLTA